MTDTDHCFHSRPQVEAAPCRTQLTNASGHDFADRSFMVERRVASATEATQEFKFLSGEPWCAVRNIGDLHMCACNFAAVARDVHDWNLDTLGNALISRHLQASGRVLGRPQQDASRELHIALANTDVQNDMATMSSAARFYMEVGHFTS